MRIHTFVFPCLSALAVCSVADQAIGECARAFVHLGITTSVIIVVKFVVSLHGEDGWTDIPICC